MAKAYAVVSYRSISDPAALSAYAALAGPAVVAVGGRFLARDVATKAYEAGQLDRTTIIEYPSVEAAVAAYESEAYGKALAALGKGAERDYRIVEALE